MLHAQYYAPIEQEALSNEQETKLNSKLIPLCKYELDQNQKGISFTFADMKGVTPFIFIFIFQDYSFILDEQLLSMEEIEQNLRKSNINLVDGGKSFTYVNEECDSSPFIYRRVAIIIPYRDRLESLLVFLNNMVVYLIAQKINFGIFLIEPEASLQFNRGFLMNIGFNEMLKSYMQPQGYNSSQAYWDCFIFHDVDMIPQDIRVEYSCDRHLPIQMAMAVQKYYYKYLPHYFGGVTAFTRDQFEKVNGYSNFYFGWGSEGKLFSPLA
jgi:hypothetical protein